MSVVFFLNCVAWASSSSTHIKSRFPCRNLSREPRNRWGVGEFTVPFHCLIQPCLACILLYITAKGLSLKSPINSSTTHLFSLFSLCIHAKVLAEELVSFKQATNKIASALSCKATSKPRLGEINVSFAVSKDESRK